MSATNDSRRLDISLSRDLEHDVPPEVPDTASIEIDYSGERRVVTIEHGQDEWILEFEDGRCVDRDPATRPLPKWMGEVLELVRGEIQ